MGLGERLEELGRTIGEREASHAAGLGEARARAEELRESVAAAVDRFNESAGKAGAPHVEVAVSTVRTDDKHLRSWQFDLRRGRHCAVVTVKSRGEITLVGPFRQGKTEGPCRSFPLDAAEEVEHAMGDFLAAFVEDAASP